MAVPALLALIIGFAMFKRRVGGVYFAIITQAIAAILTILIVGQQGYTGGINGITDLKTLHGWDIRTDHAKLHPLLRQRCGLLLGDDAGLRAAVCASKLGRLLVAMRDKEERVRFSGYDVANFKIFVFVLAAALAAIGGAMFTLQVGFMSPSFVGIVPSIEMVIFAAVGGRDSLLGAVYGTLVVNWGKTSSPRASRSSGCSLMGGLFIAVVMVFPQRPGRPRSTDAGRCPGSSALRETPRGAVPRSPPAARRAPPSQERATMTSQHRLTCSPSKALTRLVRRLQGRRRLSSLRRQERAARDHRPQRRRQDHACST